ncbi:unnamed protein product, partial [Phaeothamnion confervicola]
GRVGSLPACWLLLPCLSPSAAGSDFMGQWEARLREKATLEKQKEAEAKEAARKERNKFMADRAAMREAKMAQNRTQEQVFLEQLEADLESDNPWERVVNLVDTQADVSKEFQDAGRMRSIFIQLKNDPLEVHRAIS